MLRHLRLAIEEVNLSSVPCSTSVNLGFCPLITE